VSPAEQDIPEIPELPEISPKDVVAGETQMEVINVQSSEDEEVRAENIFLEIVDFFPISN